MATEQIREIPVGSGQSEGISKFLFLINTSKYRTSCCCGLFTLRAAIYIFAIIEIISGAVSALSILLEADRVRFYDSSSGSRASFYVVQLINVMPALPAVLAIHGAAHTNAKKVSYYYYAKVAQIFLLPIPQIVESRRNCRAYGCTRGDFVGTLLSLAMITMIAVYIAHVLFSYVNLVVRGEIVLANNGRDVVQAMEQYRRQAAALELQPSAVVVGAPVATPVRMGEPVAFDGGVTPQ